MKAAPLLVGTPAMPTPAPARPLHVLQVVGNAIVGGMESWVARTVERLPRERFRFSALCPFESPFTDRLRALGVEVTIAPMPDDPPWSTLQTATALVAQGGVDLLHAHLPRAHLLAGLVGRLTDVPVLTTIHARQLATLDLEVHRLTGSHLSMVCRQSYFHALGLGVDARLASCEPNGVDTHAFRPRPRGRDGLRAALGIAAEAPLVGFVGRLSPEKGPEVLLRALLVLRTQCPAAQVVFVGEGPMRAELQALAEALGVAGAVHFAGARADMPRVYAEFDVLACSSHTEAMPLAVLEAMACGVPVVASRVGGVPEIVEPGRSGCLVAPGDFDDLAGCCARLLAEPALRRAMGERARQRAVERLALQPAVDRVGRLLTRLARHEAADAAAAASPVATAAVSPLRSPLRNGSAPRRDN
jgi:glycosyltransferase involved in cell wall biosynthesis